MRTIVTVYFENGNMIEGLTEESVGDIQEKLNSSDSRLVLRTGTGGVIEIPHEIAHKVCIRLESEQQLYDYLE